MNERKSSDRHCPHCGCELYFMRGVAGRPMVDLFLYSCPIHKIVEPVEFQKAPE